MGIIFETPCFKNAKNDPTVALRSIHGDISSVAPYQPVALEYKHIEIESLSRDEIEFIIDVSFAVDFATYAMLKEGDPFGEDVILVVDIEHPPRYPFLMVLLTFPRNLSVYDSFSLACELTWGHNVLDFKNC